MNFLSRVLAYRVARETMREPSAVRQIAGGIFWGFFGVLAGLILLGLLIDALT